MEQPPSKCPGQSDVLPCVATEPEWPLLVARLGFVAGQLTERLPDWLKANEQWRVVRLAYADPVRADLGVGQPAPV